MQLPAEFEKKMKDLLGEEWDDFLNCYSQDKYQALRFNPLKVKAEDEERLLSDLAITGLDKEESGEKVPWAEHGYYYDADCRPGKHPWHECGLYYIQEPSAMSAAALLAPEPGMRVLDLCAAPGGKSTQLSSYLGRDGLLVSNEINGGRCRILSQNIERLGIPNCIVTNQDSASLAEHFPAYFHEVLVDAPCSGEGMFRKIPEACEEWSPENVKLCAKRQSEILDNAAEMLAPGGRMVYSTCTFSPEENEGQIAAFLKRHPEFEIEETDAPYFSPARPEWIPDQKIDPEILEQVRKTFRLWPHKLHGEGHFAAVMRKSGELQWSRKESYGSPSMADVREDCRSAEKKKSRNAFQKDSRSNKSGKKAERNNRGKGEKQASGEGLEEFLAQTLSKEEYQYIKNGNLITFGDQVYRLPDEAPPLGGLRVLRAGLQLGAFCKDRFEPSHALALALSPADAVNCISLSRQDPRCSAYFRGETFEVHEEDFPGGKIPQKGWCLITIEGYSAGWGKIAGGRLKNHYPKGLRTNI